MQIRCFAVICIGIVATSVNAVTLQRLDQNILDEKITANNDIASTGNIANDPMGGMTYGPETGNAVKDGVVGAAMGAFANVAASLENHVAKHAGNNALGVPGR